MIRVRVLFVIVILLLTLGSSCRRRSDTFVIALGDNIRTIDPIGSPSVDAASERVRTLMFNSLVKKDEKFDYVGELAVIGLRPEMVVGGGANQLRGNTNSSARSYHGSFDQSIHP